MLAPSAPSARRSSALLRIASAPTSSAGRTMREKPKRSLRWKVTDERYADEGRADLPVARAIVPAPLARLGRGASVGGDGHVHRHPRAQRMGGIGAAVHRDPDGEALD